MNERYFFADVDLPFHFWVREGTASRGFRWVLREAPHGEQGLCGPAFTSPEQPRSASGGE